MLINKQVITSCDKKYKRTVKLTEQSTIKDMVTLRGKQTREQKNDK